MRRGVSVVRVAVAVFLSTVSVGAGASTPSCPDELIRVGEKLRGERSPQRSRMTRAAAQALGMESLGPTADGAVPPTPEEKLAAAKEAALFLIHSAYPAKGEEGILRSSSPAMLLHRNRLRILLGEERKVPLSFLTDLESRTRRTSLAGRALEERLWNFERERLAKDPKFQPETVRQVVTVIAKVLERKEAKPLSDFVLHHYEDALSIVGVSNEVDELRWKVI